MTTKDAKIRISQTSENSPLLVMNCDQGGYVKVYFYNTIHSRLMERNGKGVIGVFHCRSDLSALSRRL